MRRATASIAGVLEGLELRQPVVVTRRLLVEVLEEAGSKLRPTDVAERLVREGWLLPLRTRDAWEFAPAARAGAFPSGDPWMELRALLEHDGDVPVAVAFESAVWEWGYTSHQPTRPVFAHQPGWRPPRSLDDARAVSYPWRLPTVTMTSGLPVWQPATIVAAAATRPGAQGDWANADDWLPETMRATTPDEVLDEIRGRGTAALARLGYFAEWSGRRDIADRVEELVARPLPVTFLGPRDRRDRWIKRWRLYDALLPQR